MSDLARFSTLCCAALLSATVARAQAPDGADAVFGPASDGGYYLVGLNSPCAGLFAGIDWGSERVLAQTLARARELGLEVEAIATRSDLDTPADLAVFHDRAVVMQRGRELVELDR